MILLLLFGRRESKCHSTINSSISIRHISIIAKTERTLYQNCKEARKVKSNSQDSDWAAMELWPSENNILSHYSIMIAQAHKYSSNIWKSLYLL